MGPGKPSATRRGTTAFPREVIEHALAHGIADKAETAYQRGSLFDNRRHLMGDWAKACQHVEIISRWLRLEWLRIRSEQIFRELHRAFLSNPAPHILGAQIMEAFSTYEATKSSANIVLSTRIFDELNPSLTQEWTDIKASLTQ